MESINCFAFTKSLRSQLMYLSQLYTVGHIHQSSTAVCCWISYRATPWLYYTKAASFWISFYTPREGSRCVHEAWSFAFDFSQRMAYPACDKDFTSRFSDPLSSLISSWFHYGETGQWPSRLVILWFFHKGGLAGLRQGFHVTLSDP